MRHEPLAEHARTRRFQNLFQEQRGFSLDDLDRFDMPVPKERRTGALWRRIPAEDLPRLLNGKPPARADGPGDADQSAPDPAGADRIWPALRPAGPGPEDRRIQTEICGWSGVADPSCLPLRGSFADFRHALRTHLTGIDSRTKAPAQDMDSLSQMVGPVAARAYLDGGIGLSELPYQSRHRDGLGAYRLGEAQLEDLGYYQRLPPRPATDDRSRRGADAAPAWNGRFTGRRGIGSIADLMSPSAQERVILEGFVQHLRDISGLLPDGRFLAEWLGRPISGRQGSTAVDGLPGTRLTVSALLAAAQIHGATAVVDAVIHSDNPMRGKAMARTLRTFAGYATPFDGVPRPADPEIDNVMARVREASTEGQAVPRQRTTQPSQYLSYAL